MLYKDKVDGPLGAYLSMRDIKVSIYNFFCCIMHNASCMLLFESVARLAA